MAASMKDKVILVIIDGLKYQTAIEQCGYLEALVESKKARRMKMIAVLPTLSAPIYETLHTGLEPLEHGITSNDNLRKSKFKNIFAIAKASGLVTAAAAHSFFSTLYNEDPYIPIRDQEVNDPDQAIQHGRFYSENGYSAFNIALPSDHDLMNQASMLVSRYEPHYLMIHSCSCDSIGHKFGGNSLEYSKPFLDPFATKDGVSLGYNAYFRETDYGEYNVANYLTNSNGFGLQYGWPISDTQRLNLSLTYDKTDIDIGRQPAREIWDFVNAEGNIFETLNLQTQWQRVTLNRGMYPTDGASTAISLSATV